MLLVAYSRACSSSGLGSTVKIKQRDVNESAGEKTYGIYGLTMSVFLVDGSEFGDGDANARERKHIVLIRRESFGSMSAGKSR